MFEKFLEQINETNISLDNIWVWMSVYFFGLMTWGRHATINYAKKFASSKCNGDILCDIVGITFLWVFSPFWSIIISVGSSFWSIIIPTGNFFFDKLYLVYQKFFHLNNDNRNRNV